MNIVLDESEFVDKALRELSLGQKPTETLTRVARYYVNQGHRRRDDIRSFLERFMLQCDPTINLVKWQNTIDSIIKGAKKYNLIHIESVPVTAKELAMCDSVTGKQAKRLLFTLICIAKYADMVNDNNNGWVNQPDKEIFRMANIVTPVKRQSLMLNDLRDAGFIKFSKKVDNVNINVLCMDKEGDSVLNIRDFRNLGYQYMKNCGEPYIECAQCGLVIKRRNNSHKYCHECAEDVNREKSRQRTA